MTRDAIWFAPTVASARRAQDASARRAQVASARRAQDASARRAQVASARRAQVASARRAQDASARRARDASAKARGERAPARRSLASPRATAALVRALASGEPVVVVDPPRRSAAWDRAKRAILLPPAPGLLHDAIGGIAVHEAPAARAGKRDGGATRAHWVPGDLTDRRAAAILDSPPVPPLWVVEDFRRLRIGPAMRAKLDAAGIRIAAYRALRLARRGRRR